jgi:hypothetical protein
MGCGEALRGEYVPDTTLKPKLIIEKVDTSKQQLNKQIEIPKNNQPRKGMSFDSQMNTRQPYKRIN